MNLEAKDWVLLISNLAMFFLLLWEKRRTRKSQDITDAKAIAETKKILKELGEPISEVVIVEKPKESKSKNLPAIVKYILVVFLGVIPIGINLWLLYGLLRETAPVTRGDIFTIVFISILTAGWVYNIYARSKRYEISDFEIEHKQIEERKLELRRQGMIDQARWKEEKTRQQELIDAGVKRIKDLDK
jgi:hypothetical protein